MSTAVRFNEVTKKFGSQVALDEVTLEIPQGVVFALLGENGAGKTTSLRIMLGLTEADAGQSEVLGLDSKTQGLEIRRRVGYVPEMPTMYDWMTVGEIGWFTAGFYSGGFLPRYNELAEQFGLDLSKKIKSISKGMRAKVALSLAMAHDPELLVLDEPTSGLDPIVRREFLESMVDLAADGKTVLLSSHQINEVERVADMVAIIRGGKVVLVERLDTLKSEIQQLTVTLSNGMPEPPAIDGEVLREQRRERQWRVLARSLGPEQIEQLRGHESVGSVDACSASLEEIFVAYMKR